MQATRFKKTFFFISGITGFVITIGFELIESHANTFNC